MTNEFTKELMAITQYAISSDTIYTEIKDIEALEELINDYDDMAKSLIQYTLGIEVEVKS